VHNLVILLIKSLAVALGGVHGDICVAQERLDGRWLVCGQAGGRGDSDTGLYKHVLCLISERSVMDAEDAFCNLLRSVGTIQVFKDNRELIPT
jgi:hypothetical protein